MYFDPDNKIIQLCGEGMNMEGEGKSDEASQLFYKAWNESENDFDKMISAHYVARHQRNVSDKLKWDDIALKRAQQVEDQNHIKGFYPSLYLNVGKGYEDLMDYENALRNYELAFSFVDALSEDGYGNMIKSGIVHGIERVKMS